MVKSCKKLRAIYIALKVLHCAMYTANIYVAIPINRNLIKIRSNRIDEYLWPNYYGNSYDT